MRTDKELRKAIGSRFTIIRNFYKLTQSEMAKKIGLKTQATYSQYENGSREMSFLTMNKYSELGWSITWIISGVGPQHIIPDKDLTDKAFQDILEFILDSVKNRDDKPDTEKVTASAKLAFFELVSLYGKVEDVERSEWFSEHRRIIRTISDTWK